MKIAVVGTGYVGLVSGTCFAETGIDVTCIDIDTNKIENLKKGIMPIYEPGLEELVLRNVEKKRLNFTTNLAEGIKDAEAVFIAVGTPPGEDGSADLKYVLAVAKAIGENLQNYLVVVTKSTVPVGTSEKVKMEVKQALDKRDCALDFDVASNPEFLKEGAAIDDFLKPDRIVVGIESSKAEDIMKKLYKPFLMNGHPLLFMDIRSSEMTKYAANSMLATKISFMNDVANLCELVGADVNMVRKGIGSDARIGTRFIYPGVGYGGSCFPKDVMALQKSGEQHGVTLGVLNAVTQANENHKIHLANKVVKQLGGNLKGKVVAVWGLAFKPGTDDVRETPAHTFIQVAVKAGATVVAHDPKANETYIRDFGTNPAVKLVTDAYSALQGADALILVTEWSEYKRPNWTKVKSLMRSHNVFDFRNQYVANDVIQAGFHYRCVGRPDSVVKV